MAGIVAKNLDAPEEVRNPDKTEINVVPVGATEVGRFTFQPGWRWSECIKPVVGTDELPGRTSRPRDLGPLARRARGRDGSRDRPR
jgi:hypothetical protein